ncbi:MAG TPA: hypothetical protein VKB78_10040, partial [Pirellulales bacterium]|nr:hypothetical protein [Pirellulales bacterium]
ESVAAGKGVVVEVPDSSPPRTEPFYYWGPGAPLAFGRWLKLVGGDTMRTFFCFAIAAQLLFGVMAIATVKLYTDNIWALALTAFCTGFCPPLQQWFYGINLTSSEIVALVPLSFLMFALAKGFLAYREVPSHPIGKVFSRACRAALPWRVWGWFATASVLIGLQSLVRDSATAFATFAACFLVGRAIVVDRKRFLLAASTAAILLVGVFAIRQPVRMWNKQRIGMSTVCTSSDGCIWRYGLWMQHDKYDWYQSSGIGFGEYLDHDAAARVEDYFRSGRPNPELYSLRQFVQAVAARPGAAVAFKVERLPVLWLGTDRWPNAQWGLTQVWCMAFYLLLAALLIMLLRRRQYVPEPLYLYLLLIVCASPLIHFEFRYTFPIWNALVFVPGLLLAAIGRGSRHTRLSLCESAPLCGAKRDDVSSWQRALLPKTNAA